LAAAIKAKKGVDPDIEVGSGGVFEVFKDGQLVFSKKALGRFPDSDEEVLSKL
jgi:selT/selW/selH-like putative selenoprotein